MPGTDPRVPEAIRPMLAETIRLLEAELPGLLSRVNLREGVGGSVYRSRIGRAVETVRFLKYVVRECNGLF